MTSNFSYEIRVLMCQYCGAPLDVETGGGSVKCDYCEAINEIIPRQTEAQLEHKDISEEDRLSRLWAQDGKPIPPPDAIKGLLSNGEVTAGKVNEAINVFNSTRKEVASSSDYEASERLTFLTLVLYNRYVKTNETKRQRAILESAVEAFKLPHHKQFVLGILSRCAVKDGDLQTAKEWLRPCDPHSDDLRADTTYRVGQALIHTAEGRIDKVHKLLGEGARDVPIADGYHAIATVLRANAWEKRGHVDTARSLLTEFSQGGGPHGLEGLKFVIGIYQHLQLCQNSMPSVKSMPAAKKSASAVPGLVFLVIGAILVAIGLLMGSSSIDLYSSGIKTEGTVTNMVARRDSPTDMTDMSVSYYPVILFTTEGGTAIQYQSNVGSSPPAYQVGEIVEVLYKPGNPQNASINSFFQLWGATAILGGIGLLFAIIGFILTISALTKRKN